MNLGIRVSGICGFDRYLCEMNGVVEENFLYGRLEERRNTDSLRELSFHENLVDFCSNDYLGIVRNGLLENGTGTQVGRSVLHHGSTGSRLLKGNYPLIEEAESRIASFHDSEAALIFNSGYDANIGLLSSVARRGDTIIYDQFAHASIRDGVRLGFAKGFAFAHNDCNDLEQKLGHASGNTFVVTESIFSMDGDRADLSRILQLCQLRGAHLIVDEAHSVGLDGEMGEGLAQSNQLHKKCFARVHTFGKAMGCHGAAISGSRLLKNYLINFARPFIYTTALPESAVAAILGAYRIVPAMKEERRQLTNIIRLFQDAPSRFIKLKTQSPIQVLIIPGNTEVKRVASTLRENGLDVRAILYPTVSRGAERLRIVLHSFNTENEIEKLNQLLR